MADNLVQPITKLVDATNMVRAGDLAVEVNLSNIEDEINTLQLAFNQMTSQLHQQHNQLIEANHEMNVRRIFIETVISNLSSGVITLDEFSNVTLFNTYAQECLRLPNDAVGGSVLEFCPELSGMIEFDWSKSEISNANKVTINRDNISINLSVRIVVFHGGYIVTFNDITKLVAAQNAATWADIARKIAHEIKNPITPICLASSRLKRLLRHDIKNGDFQFDLFDRYIDTIMRNSSNLSRIVDEFANFARMPNPVMCEFDVVKLLNAVVFSRQVADSNISYSLCLPEDKTLVLGDEGQIELVVYNLLKNSFQSILEGGVDEGKIVITLGLLKPGLININITDNGPGFDESLIDKLLEPYVTTRPSGNGLGLAIAKKIIDEHGGEITLVNIHDECGSCIGAGVTITFFTDRASKVLHSDE